jgi:hypothetical protein
MQALLLALLLSLQASKYDTEPPKDRETRLETCSVAISEVVKSAHWPEGPNHLAVVLVSIAEMETHFAKHIHEGHCRPEECDGGRATSLWQLHENGHLPREQWLKLAGTSPEPTRLSA